VSVAALYGPLALWAPIVAIALVGWYVARGAGGQALSIMREANDVLRDKVTALESQHKADLQQIALLEARTSLEPMVAAVVDQFELHELRAAERHEALLTIAAAIADDLKTHTNGRPGGRRAHDPPSGPPKPRSS
jgi:hypothetical protein